MNTAFYYSCCLEYAEDVSSGLLEAQNHPVIKIEESFQIDNLNFSIAAIIYFQSMHYTIHILGAQHPTLMPNEMIKWFYHDGIKDSIFKR